MCSAEAGSPRTTDRRLLKMSFLEFAIARSLARPNAELKSFEAKIKEMVSSKRKILRTQQLRMKGSKMHASQAGKNRRRQRLRAWCAVV